jgi:ABC-type multidrug transport system fused ATPase/permease subunit
MTVIKQNKLIKGFKEITPEYYSIPRKEVFREFWEIARLQKSLLSLLIFLMLLQGGVIGGSIWLVKTAIDYFFKNSSLNSILFLISALFAATVLKSTLQFLFNWSKLLAIARIKDKFIIKSFRNLIFNPFHVHIKERDRRKYGWVLKDATNFISSFFDIFNSWVKQPFILISTISALMIISPYLTCIGIIVVPFGIPPILFLKRKLKDFIAERKLLLGLQEEIVSETIRNIRIVKIFGLEENAIGRLRQTVDKQRLINQKNAFFTGLMSPISEMLGLIGLSVIIFIGSSDILSSTFTTGTFFVFIMSFLGIYRPIKDVSNGYFNYHLMLDSGSRLIKLRMNAQKEINRKGTIRVNHFKNLEIKNLWFSYSDSPDTNDEYVLRNLSLSIKHGETIAIAGATGAGKSTLCDILFGLYRPHRGVIFLNATNFDRINIKSCRNLFSMCSQETILFNNSLLEEIRIARPEATRVDVIEAAETAGLSTYIKNLENGLDTWVGDHGIHFSGGQRQMIALARALLQKPEVLVLDEALSGIDMETGKKIWENIREKLPECTILIISHHWHIIKHCDRVVVLFEGHIAKDVKIEDVTDPDSFFSEFNLNNKT